MGSVSRTSGSDERVLTLRELNRATLARQLLLERKRLPVVRAVELFPAPERWVPSPVWFALDDLSLVFREIAAARIGEPFGVQVKPDLLPGPGDGADDLAEERRPETAREERVSGSTK